MLNNIYHKYTEYFVSKCAIKTQTKEVLVTFSLDMSRSFSEVVQPLKKSRYGPISDQSQAIPIQTSTPKYERRGNPTFVVTGSLTICNDDIKRVAVLL